jgi:hypothetical protein
MAIPVISWLTQRLTDVEKYQSLAKEYAAQKAEWAKLRNEYNYVTADGKFILN